MEENKYRLAGWLAVVQAILFPIMFLIGAIEAGIAQGVFHFKGQFIGPSDLVGVVFTIIAIYTLLRFRALLNERYNYHDLDLLVTISIAWLVVFQVLGLAIGLASMILSPVDEVVQVVVLAVFFTAAMVSIGIVDILIAVKLLKVRDVFGDYIRTYGYISMIAGICEVTVFLTPLALLMVPVSAVVLALIFFRDQEAPEFV